MLFDRFVDFAYLYTILDMPQQIRIVCLHKDAVLCFVNNGLADKTSTEPGLDRTETVFLIFSRTPDGTYKNVLSVVFFNNF